MKEELKVIDTLIKSRLGTRSQYYSEWKKLIAEEKPKKKVSKAKSKEE